MGSENKKVKRVLFKDLFQPGLRMSIIHHLCEGMKPTEVCIRVEEEFLKEDEYLDHGSISEVWQNLNSKGLIKVL